MKALWVYADDWTCLYIDGELVHSGHSCDASFLLTWMIGRTINIDSVFAERYEEADLDRYSFYDFCELMKDKHFGTNG